MLLQLSQVETVGGSSRSCTAAKNRKDPVQPCKCSSVRAHSFMRSVDPPCRAFQKALRNLVTTSESCLIFCQSQIRSGGPSCSFVWFNLSLGDRKWGRASCSTARGQHCWYEFAIPSPQTPNKLADRSCQFLWTRLEIQAAVRAVIAAVRKRSVLLT